MNEKLGWLRQFRGHIRRWNECQNVLSAALTFINEQGLFQDAWNRLASHLQSLYACEASQAVADRLVEFLRESEGKLAVGSEAADEHRDSGVVIWSVQATGAATQQTRIHESAGGVWIAAETGHGRINPP